MPIVPILVAVLIVVGTVALFLSRTTWHWYNITLVALIMIMAMVWFYLAARTLKTIDAWQKEVVLYESRIKQMEAENKLLREGEREGDELVKPGTEQLRIEVERLLQGRGRMWGQVARKEVAPETGIITATVERPMPHGIAPNTILYVFDGIDARNGGEFLGEFEASEVNGPEVKLRPVLPLRKSEIDRLTSKRAAPLVLYEIMPLDNRELFSAMSDEERAAALANLPADVQQEYAKDGKPPLPDEKDTQRIWRRVRALKDFEVAGPGENADTIQITTGTVLLLDPKSADERIAAGDVEPVEGDDKVYVRTVRDYARLYRDLNLQIDSLLRTTAEVEGQLATVGTAQKKVGQDIDYRTKEVEALKRDLARYQSERAMIAAHVAALDLRVADTRAELRKLHQENRDKEIELAQLTRQSAEIINRRAPPVESTTSAR